MNELPLPFLLCTSQFFIASIIVGFYSKYVSGSYRKIQPSAKILVYQISLSYTFGFIFTNTAFSLGENRFLIISCITNSFELNKPPDPYFVMSLSSYAANRIIEFDLAKR